ncbi:hypothetical protein THRCLA_09999, partial [Thraustotheca clavata]
ARFHEAFPLSLELWQHYLSLAPHMLAEALKDYLQPSLYYQYIETIDDDPEAEELWSDVLSALGCHWRESEKVYGLYRSFLRDSILDQQILFERFKSSYESQLAIPLFDGHDRVLSEYRAWSEYQSSSNAIQKSLHAISTTIKRTKNIYKDMSAFEAQLDAAAMAAQPEMELQEIWLKYITYLKEKIKVVGVSIIMNVLERAVAQVCLSSTLWQSYLDFLLEQKMYSNMISTGMRAVRNVPFVASVWVSLLIALEANGGFESYEVILDDLEGRKSLSLDQLLIVLLAYCDTIRRQLPHELKSTFQRCEELLDEYPSGVNVLRMYQAKCLVPLENGPSRWTKQCISLWDDILKLDTTLAVWQTCMSECIRANASVHVIRNYYRRGIKAITDYPGVFAEAFVNFEREMGESVILFVEAQALRDATQGKVQKIAAEQAKQEQAQYKQVQREQVQNEQAVETKTNDDPKPKPTILSNEDKAKRAEAKKRKLEDELQRQEDYKRQRTADKEGRTIFIYRLDKSITKEDLENVFAPIGALSEVRIPTKTPDSNVSRGMAFVTFEDAANVEKALTLNGLEYSGATLNVSRSEPQAKAKKIIDKDGVWTTNPTTIYVADINKLVKESDLQEVLGKFGAIKAVMILGRRLKLYALVEFEEKQGAVNVLLCEDNIEICGQRVRVKKSRFSVKDMLDQQAKAKANNKQEPSNKKQEKKPAKAASIPKRASEHPSSHPATRIALPTKAAPTEIKSEAAPATAMKSNSDFRKLFMQ